jgi:SAM-dependent methyltransferase
MMPGWYFDERRHAGEEHVDADQVARYDEKAPFDPAAEVDLLRNHGLSDDDIVVDFGTGTGVFPIAVAEYCDRVVGVDVSEAMLEIAREKAAAEGVENVEFVHQGMVRYDHDGPSASFVFSKNALHHLPDFWKVEALKTIGESLEPGGILRLRDLVYSFDPAAGQERIEGWLDQMESTTFTEKELHNHFREEFSTYGFLMEPMLERTGFDILDASYRDGFYGAYTCKWEGSRQ